MLLTLKAQILSILNYGSPIWHSMATQNEVIKLERVLKTGLRIIYGDTYETYEVALNRAGLKNLQFQREKQIKAFIHKNIHSEKFSKWFVPIQEREGLKTRNELKNRDIYKNIYCWTCDFRNSPIPYMTRMANTHNIKWQLGV